MGARTLAVSSSRCVLLLDVTSNLEPLELLEPIEAIRANRTK